MRDKILLKEKYQEIFSQIDVVKTKEEFPDIDVNNLLPGSNTPIYWKCIKCNGIFKDSPNNRVSHHTKCPYCQNKKVLSGFNDLHTWCIKNNRTDILEEWDYDKNLDIPKNILYCSTKKYFWICRICKTNFETTIENRINKRSCPLCLKKLRQKNATLQAQNKAKINKSFLKDKYPELFSELDFEKNKNEFPNIDLNKITHGSKISLWWKCKYCRKSFLATPNNRTNGVDCHCRLNYKKSEKREKIEEEKAVHLNCTFKEKCPESWNKLDIERNKKEYPFVDLNKISVYSHRKLFFKCVKCGGSYQQSPYQIFSTNASCPICANQKVLAGYNDLFSYCKNNNLSIIEEYIDDTSSNQVYFRSTKKYKWKCGACNQEYYASPYNRIINNTGCPYCSHQKILPGITDLQTKYPEIAKTWDYSKNNKKPNEIFPGTQKKYWWICNKCGNSYYMSVYDRVHGNSCQFCGRRKSIPELVSFEYFKLYIDSDAVSGYSLYSKEIDIYSKKYHAGIEIDGNYWHSSTDAKIRENKKNIVILKHPEELLIRIKDTKEKINKEIIKNKNIITIFYNSSCGINNIYKNLSVSLQKAFNIIREYRKLPKISYNFDNIMDYVRNIGSKK